MDTVTPSTASISASMLDTLTTSNPNTKMLPIPKIRRRNRDPRWTSLELIRLSTPSNARPYAIDHVLPLLSYFLMFVTPVATPTSDKTRV